MSKYELLTSLRIGDKVAENEGEELINYFVETHQWSQIHLYLLNAEDNPYDNRQ